MAPSTRQFGMELARQEGVSFERGDETTAVFGGRACPAVRCYSWERQAAKGHVFNTLRDKDPG